MTTMPAAGTLPADDPRRLPIEIVLPIEGMTCASGVNRIERFLKKTPGVEEASVNLATERATIRLDPAVAGRDEAVAAVRAAGYDDRAATGPEAGAPTASSALADEVTAEDFRFSPAEVTVRAGEWVSVSFTNHDAVVHAWRVEGIPNVDVAARPGQTATLRFVLDEPGTYMVMCSIPGHAEAGMVGMVVVEP